jgi:GNAT superfamily N-acetyltransferase
MKRGKTRSSRDVDDSPETQFLWHQHRENKRIEEKKVRKKTNPSHHHIVGCPDVHAFVADYERYVSTILSRDVEKPPQLAIHEPWLLPLSKNEDSGIASTSASASEKTQEEAETSSNGGNENAMVANPLALAQNAYRADWMLLENKDALTTRWRATMHIDLLPPWQGRGWGRKLIDRFVASVQSSGGDYGEGEHIGVAGENSKVVPFYEKLGFRVVEGGEREGNIWMVRDIEKV